MFVHALFHPQILPDACTIAEVENVVGHIHKLNKRFQTASSETNTGIIEEPAQQCL